MSSHAVRVRAGQGPANLYDEITDKIIAELGAYRVLWVQPWDTTAAEAQLSMLQNAATERQRSGVNLLILWAP